MAARNSSFEYFDACTKNIDEPATRSPQLQLGQNFQRFVEKLLAVVIGNSYGM
jgi:hypothetical protein